MSDAQNEKNIITFPLPSSTALFLNQAFLQQQTAIDIAKLLITHKKHDLIDKKHIHQFPQHTQSLFDYFEAIFATIVFSFSALESFANDQIGRALDCNYMHKTHDNKLYSKIDIEYKLDTSTKLGIIAKEVFNISMNKQSSAWSNYKQLAKLRNDIIHLKYDMQKSSKAENRTIYGKLLPNINKPTDKILPIKPVNCALKLLEYLYRENKPSWLKHCPFAQ